MESMDRKMKIYFAPLEGITGYVFRNVYEECFGGVDAYFSPFISTTEKRKMRRKELNDILPEHNKGIRLVPQIMGNKAEDFLRTVSCIAELGYDTVNLNLGCPSRTVVSKGKGSGFLAKPAALNRFLEEVYAQTPVKISIKTRLGKDDPEEFVELLQIFNQYPVEELIVHPRVQADFYKNSPNWEMFGEAVQSSTVPLCYNGDIFSLEDFQRLLEQFPQVNRVMLGRGLLMHPGLARELLPEREAGSGQQWEPAWKEGSTDARFSGQNGRPAITKEQIYHYILLLQERYSEVLSGEIPVLFKMKEIWGFLIESFQDGDKFRKKIHKCQSLAGYRRILEELFLNLELRN